MSESTMTIDEFGIKRWRNSVGQLHRIGGPAVEWANGDKEWWANGYRHRVGGPAIEWDKGNKAWYVNGKCHRTNGPAAEFSSGDKSWYVSGKLLGYDEEGFWALWERLTDEQKKNPVLLTYLPEKF